MIPLFGEAKRGSKVSLVCYAALTSRSCIATASHLLSTAMRIAIVAIAAMMELTSIKLFVTKLFYFALRRIRILSVHEWNQCQELTKKPPLPIL